MWIRCASSSQRVRATSPGGMDPKDAPFFDYGPGFPMDRHRVRRGADGKPVYMPTPFGVAVAIADCPQVQ